VYAIYRAAKNNTNLLIRNTGYLTMSIDSFQDEVFFQKEKRISPLFQELSNVKLNHQ